MASKFIRGMPAIAILAGLMILGTSAPARATMQLQLQSNAMTLTITDGGAGDLNPIAGAITFVGAFDTWTLNVTTGLSKPFIGSSAQPQMDVNSVDATSGAGALTIMLTDQNFSLAAPATLVQDVGGTLSAGMTGTFSAFIDPANGLFGSGGSAYTTTLPTFTNPPAAFSGSSSTALPSTLAGPYSLTLKEVITSGAAGGVASFDHAGHIDAAPEPATMSMIFMGLPVVGFMARRARRRRLSA